MDADFMTADTRKGLSEQVSRSFLGNLELLLPLWLPSFQCGAWMVLIRVVVDNNTSHEQFALRPRLKRIVRSFHNSIK